MIQGIRGCLGLLSASGTESGTEEVSASHRNRDCVALMDIGSARCPESSIHMGKAFEQEEGVLLTFCLIRSDFLFECLFRFGNTDLNSF